MSDSVRKALALSSINQYASMIIQFVAGMIIARILTPEEIGVYSVGAVVIALAHMLRDFGLGKYIIKEKDLTPTKLRAAFTLTAALAWSLGTIIFFLSPLLAKWYQNEAIVDIFHVVVINFFLTPFGSTVMTYLRREWQFKAILVAGILSNLGQVLVTITLAYNDFGYMSLAWGSVTNVVITIVCMQYFKPKWFPILPSLKGVKAILKFGTFASIESLSKEFGNGSPDLFIGKNLSMADVGYFSKGLSILRVFNTIVIQAIRPVALPYFSKVEKSQSDLGRAYTEVLYIVTGLSLPFFCFVFLCAEPIILLAFGPQWDAAVPIMKILCVGIALSSTYAFSELVLVAKDKIKILSIFTLFFQITRVIGIFIASLYSLYWCSVVFSLFFGLEAFCILFMLYKYIDLKLFSLLKAYVVNISIALISIVPILFIQNFYSHLSLLLQVLIQGMVWGGSTILLLYLFRHPVYQKVLAPIIQKINISRESSHES